ncbi:MAG: methionyl-tRNA formyltransferase [Eubacterium sp.]|nr:methionyl-tRNA formyltransferase [Eubacterium sp.]
MRIVFMGTPDFAVGTLLAMADAGHEIVGVVTQTDKPVGRKQELKPTAVKAAALERGFTVYQPAKLRKNPEFLETLKGLVPDVIVVAAYGKIIPKEILSLPKYGCLNVHASLLPKYRGAAPIQWAVIDGEEKSGVTIMQMNEGLDTGDMLATVEVPITADETGGSLFDKLAAAGAKLLVETLPKVEAGTLHPVKQPEESPTPYARMIRKEDGKIDWSLPAARIECLVRGMNPWPSAFTSLNGKGLKIWKSHLDHTVPANPAAVPGTVLSIDGGLLVQTGDGVLCITELQLEGKKRMQASDFLRGHAVETGTVLGK